MSKKFSDNKGLTLIELLIAIGIFSIVAVIFLSTFVTFLKSARQISSSQQVAENVRYAADIMTREIRTGSSYNIISVSEIAFTNFKNESVDYKLENDIIRRSSDGGISFFDLTAPSISVNDLKIIGGGLDSSDNLQSKITIIINASAKDADQSSSPVILQSSVSARNFE